MKNRKEFLRRQRTPPKKFYVSVGRIASAILPGIPGFPGISGESGVSGLHGFRAFEIYRVSGRSAPVRSGYRSGNRKTGICDIDFSV